jgi:Flp pilus assembly protein TadD
VLGRRQSRLAIPIVAMAEAEVKLVPAKVAQPLVEGRAEAQRWNDYGIGLLEQAQYGAAVSAFREAGHCDPANPDFMVNEAVAEMKTERFGPERNQIKKAALLLDAALKLAPAHARARYWQALVSRSMGRTAEAAEALGRLAAEYPRDREVLRQWGQTLYTLGRLAPARAAFEAILAIDPQDVGAYQLLIPIYLSEGRRNKADRARSLYLEWRDDPSADSIAARFFVAHPEWSDERIAAHTHSVNATRRPVLTGASAAPER